MMLTVLSIQGQIMSTDFPLFGDDINRAESDSIKWKRYRGKDILPMWVADMDFKVADPILAAIEDRVSHGVLGYGSDAPELRKAIVEHCVEHYGWHIEPSWIVFTPGVIKGLNIARAMAIKSGKTAGVTALPVYPHLMRQAPILEFNNQFFPMTKEEGGWHFDIESLKAQITADTGVLLLCNPHNPIGKVYSRHELTEIASVCEEYDLLICSDDVHCDLILNDKQHTPIASLNDKVANRSITLMAPSKTFNVAGLDMAFAIIPNAELRQQYQALMDGLVGHVNILGMSAALAAFTQAESWRKRLIAYLRDNQTLIQEALGSLKGVSFIPSEATYLAWIDVSELKLEDPKGYFETFGVGLSAGSEFGDDRYVRLNFGCQRPLLAQALVRMSQAVEARCEELGL